MCTKKIEIMWWNPQNPHSIQVQSARLHHRSIMLSGEQNLIMTSNDAFIPAGGYHGYIMFSGEQNLITTSKDVYSMIIINHFYIMIFNHEYDHKLSVS